MVEAGRGLHQRVKSAAPRPRPGMAIGRQCHIDDAGADFGGCLRREAERGDRLRPIALREDIGAGEQGAQRLAPLLALEIDKAREFAAAGIDAEPGDRRQIGTGDQKHVRTMGGERASGDGAGDHARQIEHAYAGERTVALRPRSWRGIADLLDLDQRQSGQRFCVRRCRPLLMRTHHGDDTAMGIGLGFERFAIPLQQRGLHVVALGLAA